MRRFSQVWPAPPQTGSSLMGVVLRSFRRDRTPSPRHPLSPRQSALQSAITDPEGRFSFPEVPAGSYVLHVSAMGLAEQRMPLRVQGPGATNVTADLQLMPLRTELTVTASPGSAESVESIHQSVNVIEKEAIRERTEAVLAQSAAEETGLALQRTSPTLAGIYIRGLTGNKVNVFVDGVRYTTSAQRGGINTFLDLMDPSAVQSIEVLRGPNSAQYGSDAIRRKCPTPVAVSRSPQWAPQCRQFSGNVLQQRGYDLRLESRGRLRR